MSEQYALSAIKESIDKGELVVVVGTGCSLSLTNGQLPTLSWKGLVSSGLKFSLERGKITDSQFTVRSGMLDSPDIDDILSAAEFVGVKLGAPAGDLYARWLNQSFQSARPENVEMAEAIKSIASLGVPICTLNYDSLLEQVTGLPSINSVDVRKATSWMRREESGILHLHGGWQEPSTCVLGIRDYDRELTSETRDLLQRALGSYKRLLFVGCGDTFGDPNFHALTGWLREKMGASTLQHYALVSDSQVSERRLDETWHGFVEPIGYGTTHADLPKSLMNMFASPSVIPGTILRKSSDKTAKHTELVSKYMEFLVRDCGQMTIEGVRADMDTAQRRFDLEKLFVPLDLLPCPPDISLDDPTRHEKLNRWRRKNKLPTAFGDIFERAKGLALLALPGGGKSLLLKRLAVAYANPERRSKSNDGLPNIELVPVLIRCREWRAHISLPIPTLLKSLPDITGQPELDGISVALTPLFKTGKILLLVDGLDEIHDNASRTVFVENLRSFLDQYPKTKLVVTSREAGFNLIAPYLASHCERWRVAPLSEEAITDLCSHWHKLMVGDSSEAIEDAEALSEVLTSNLALKRLAENPLLLTMLLVVKHGAGRLPPDRVSLYSRAVEVLLDTWNIKGHAALNMKEAIPQLSYIAFELMQAGKQTATEQELLVLLEKARVNVPEINRYAKDTPYEFLKRVELRSSLLLEAGHVVEGSKPVPFYQFRHLTFQEYLAALAIAEGYYDGYDIKTPITKPLARRLASDEWKEVVPMTAVLAKKQAEPLIRALVRQGVTLAEKVAAGKSFPGKENWEAYPGELPGVIARLTQSLIEEAQAEPNTLTSALRLVVYFARGCHSNMDWKSLSRGPYAQELMHQAWLFYNPMNWPENTLARNTYAHIAGLRKPAEYWLSKEGQAELNEFLNGPCPEKICLGLMTSVGAMFTSQFNLDSHKGEPEIYTRFEEFIYHESLAISHVALWNWAIYRYRRRISSLPSITLLDFFLVEFFKLSAHDEDNLYTFALECCLGLPRSYWQPVLTPEQIIFIKELLNESVETPWDRHVSTALMVAFHSGQVCSDSELAEIMIRVRQSINGGGYVVWRIDQALTQLAPYGPEFLENLRTEEDEGEEDEGEEDEGEEDFDEVDWDGIFELSPDEEGQL